MSSLLYKELLSVRPQLLCIAIIAVVLFVDTILGTDALHGVASLLTAGTEGLLLLTGGLAFALGHAQIGPEIVHGHIELLDGLPTTRTRVYVAKLATGLLATAALATSIAVVLVATTYLTWGAADADTLRAIVLSLVAGLFSFYATGLLFSWLGGFGWAVLGLGITLISTVSEFIEIMRPLSIFHAYGTVRFEANEPQFAMWPLVFWTGHGLFCVLLSGALFVARGDALTSATSGLTRVAQAVVGAVVVGFIFLLAAATLSQMTGPQFGLLSGPLSQPRMVQVGTYRVLVPATVSAAGQALLAQIPRIDERVRTMLGVKTPLSLDVELSGGGRYHAGRYTGGKIRMSVGENADDIFAHELAHAYADLLSHKRVLTHHNAVRFFNEGLAMWVAEKISKNTEEANAHRAWAGALYALGHHHLDLLMNDQARAIRYDPFEPYPLGFAFVESLVDTYSAAAVRCLLRQVGTIDDDRIAGVALWTRVLEACSIDLALVERTYETRLSEYGQQWPLPLGSTAAQPVLTSHGLMLVLPPIATSTSTEQKVRMRCRFRSRIGAPAADLSEDEFDAAGRCPVSAVISATETISFQVGITLAGEWTAYGRWIEQPIPPHTSANDRASVD
ncbi:MAG: hypothetical protein AAFN74_20395 [Myxococcota bacterium]